MAFGLILNCRWLLALALCLSMCAFFLLNNWFQNSVPLGHGRLSNKKYGYKKGHGEPCPKGLLQRVDLTSQVPLCLAQVFQAIAFES